MKGATLLGGEGACGLTLLPWPCLSAVYTPEQDPQSPSWTLLPCCQFFTLSYQHVAQLKDCQVKL